MRRLAVMSATLLAVTLAAAGPAGAASPPTPAQMSRAVAAAERSPSLWATVNICDTTGYPNTIGIRGQMPSLGFPAWLSMRIQVNYFSRVTRSFQPVPSAVRLLRLGRHTLYLQQGGATFSFPGHSGYLDATVEFIWRREGKLLGQTVQRTTAGHPSADYGDPRHYSARQCYIG